MKQEMDFLVQKYEAAVIGLTGDLKTLASKEKDILRYKVGAIKKSAFSDIKGFVKKYVLQQEAKKPVKKQVVKKKVAKKKTVKKAPKKKAAPKKKSSKKSVKRRK
jgi:adenylate kinase